MLKEKGRVKFGKRPNVYSILDGQVNSMAGCILRTSLFLCLSRAHVVETTTERRLEYKAFSVLRWMVDK